MPDPVWYKSLYWRIAFGFVAVLAVVLLLQVLVALWLTDRVVGWSAQTPEELVTSVASDLSTALTRNPELTLETYVRDEFSHIYRPFAVITTDGRTMSNRPNSLPQGYFRSMQMRMRRGESLNAADPRDGPRDRDRGFGGPPPGFPSSDRDRPPDAWRGGRPVLVALLGSSALVVDHLSPEKVRARALAVVGRAVHRADRRAHRSPWPARPWDTLSSPSIRRPYSLRFASSARR